MTTGFGPQSTVYTTPGAFVYNVPANRSLVWVTLQGGGMGGNGCGAGPFNSGGGGGGAGELCVHVPCVVTPGGTVNGVVGAGGAPGFQPEGVGGTGEDSIFGQLRARGAPQDQSPLPFNSGVKGGGANNGGDGGNGIMGTGDAPAWWAGSSGGNHSAGSNPLRIGGPAGGRYGAAAAASSDRGGGPGSSTIFAAGAVGVEPGSNGTSGIFGCGAGGGGGSSSRGGTGGAGYVLIEHV